MNVFEFVRINRTNGVRHTIDLTATVARGARVLDWGFIPGTDEITAVVSKGDSTITEVLAFAFGENGEATGLRVVGPAAVGAPQRPSYQAPFHICSQCLKTPKPTRRND